MSIGYMEVTSKDNPSVKLYRKLAGNKKSRMQEQCFILEGYRLVSDAIKNSAQIKMLFFTDEALERYGEEFLAYINSDCRSYLITSDISEYMAETECPQGIFAICNMSKRVSLSEFFRKGNVFAVLHRLQDPGNAGMILRTADALGVSGVVFCKSCDIYSPKVVRATMGSLFRVPFAICNDENELFSNLEESRIQSDAAVVTGQAEFIGRNKYPEGKHAVWIGNEGSGLTDEVIRRCTRRVTIPMQGNIESLNAAMAAGILMWEMMKGRESIDA